VRVHTQAFVELRCVCTDRVYCDYDATTWRCQCGRTGLLSFVNDPATPNHQWMPDHATYTAVLTTYRDEIERITRNLWKPSC